VLAESIPPFEGKIYALINGVKYPILDSQGNIAVFVRSLSSNPTKWRDTFCRHGMGTDFSTVHNIYCVSGKTDLEGTKIWQEQDSIRFRFGEDWGFTTLQGVYSGAYGCDQSPHSFEVFFTPEAERDGVYINSVHYLAAGGNWENKYQGGINIANNTAPVYLRDMIWYPPQITPTPTPSPTSSIFHCPFITPRITAVNDSPDANTAWTISWTDSNSGENNEDSFKIISRCCHEGSCGCYGGGGGRNCQEEIFSAPQDTTSFTEKKADFFCHSVSFRVCAVKAGCPDLCGDFKTFNLTNAPCLKLDADFSTKIDRNDNFNFSCLSCNSSQSCWFSCQVFDYNNDGGVDSTDENTFTNLFPSCEGVSFCKCLRAPSTPTPPLSPTPALTATPSPTPISPPSPTPLASWFQTKEGDVHSNADIISRLPDISKFFSLKGEGGFPGIVSCLRKNPYFGQGKVSEKEWLATGFKIKRRYDYSYFNTLLDIPNENIINNGLLPSVIDGDKINNETLANFPFWKIEGDLEVENLNDDLEVKVFLASGKIIFKNDLALQNTLPVFIAQGDIEIKPEVHLLTGVLISGGEINTGMIKEEQTFILNGAAISWDNFSLERERKTNNEPAEFFIYNPEIFLKLLPFLGKSPHLWEELAP